MSSSQLSDLTEYDYSQTAHSNGSQTTAPFEFPPISPPFLELSQKARAQFAATSTNVNTRPPKHYDMHLHDDLILKQVKFMPDGTDIRGHLCAAVDNAFETHAVDLPSGVIPNEVKIAGWKAGRFMTNESAIVDFYHNTTAKTALKLASGLALGSQGWTRLLKFGQTDPENFGGGAISDGFLSMDPLQIGIAKGDCGPAGERLINLLEDDHICNRALLVWEFKNMKAGGAPVMEEIAAIARSERPFHWTHCEKEASCTNKQQHFTGDGSVRVTGDRRGFDADWGTLEVFDSDAGESQSQSQSQSQTQSQDIDSSAADPSHLDGDGLKARHILQQVWAQAVKHDTTYLVIHSGNHEYIGMRHRASQTLFLSELYAPSACDPCGGYLKLHTGLYLSAVKDAEQRAFLMQQARVATPNTVPETWTRNYKCIRAKKPRKERKAVIPQASSDYEDFIAIFKRQDQFAFVSPKHPIFFDLDVPVNFTKCGTRPPLDSDHPSLLLTVEEKYGNCYRAKLSGVLYEDVDAGEANPPAQRVAIKLAETDQQREKLRHEYSVYSTLSAADEFPTGVLRPVYLFEAHHSGDHVLALVMPNAGAPFERKNYDAKSRKAIKVEFKRILTAFHTANYLHHSLDHKILLVDDDLRLTMVGLGNARYEMSLTGDVHKWDRAVARENVMLDTLF
ncbi:hypothetical protein DFH06DRAFT_1189169 [Mycena polygramma]|nr:hypothetical protein DFH06DRAFT_1189169 [Mycena polygramma]